YKGPKTASLTIAGLAQKAGTFKTLIAVAKAAGLVEALNGTSPLTVFAPTDDAFAKLPKETLDFLLTAEGEATLIKIVKNHVVVGRLSAADLIAKTKVKTLAGTTIRLRSSQAGYTISGSRILKTDLHASNGIVHVIGEVMVPKSPKKRLF
ncbi:MAG: fasciclin domain-containing protein, partial [Planctomycetota bacterium]|nr:fasciclin domain-containing protein [Planctomycetota bacterium]